jgi:Ca2+-binding RTX toxin-like protein
VLTANAAGDILSAASGNDTLLGGVGNDTLDGGLGADAMAGGKGDDIYVVDNAADTVTENAGEGLDGVQASVDYTLTANVENLTLFGTRVLTGTGNSLDNLMIASAAGSNLFGNAGNDCLLGAAGSDFLDGGLGSDQLAAGAGNDSLLFSNDASWG